MCPDYGGRFHLQPVHDSLQDFQLMDEMERLHLSGHQSGHLPSPSRVFTPLLDVPVDGYSTSTLRSRSPSPSPNHSLQRGRQQSRSPQRGENGSSHYDGASLLSVHDRTDATLQRGRSPVRNGHGRERREASPDSVDGRWQTRPDGFTEVSVRVPSQRRGRTPLAEVFEPTGDRSVSTGRGSGSQVSRPSQNGERRRTTLPPEEYDVSTLTISKAKQSLGENETQTYSLFRFKRLVQTRFVIQIASK